MTAKEIKQLLADAGIHPIKLRGEWTLYRVDPETGALFVPTSRGDLNYMRYDTDEGGRWCASIDAENYGIRYKSLEEMARRYKLLGRPPKTSTTTLSRTRHP